MKYLIVEDQLGRMVGGMPIEPRIADSVRYQLGQAVGKFEMKMVRVFTERHGSAPSGGIMTCDVVWKRKGAGAYEVTAFTKIGDRLWGTTNYRAVEVEGDQITGGQL